MVCASAANSDWQVDLGLVASSSHLPQVHLAQHLRFPQGVTRSGKTISDFPDAFKTYTDGSPSIARIDKNLLPPPHDLDAVIRCIVYVEGFSPNVWHQIFSSIASESPIEDLNVWDMRHGCPGSLPEKPLIFVKSAQMNHPFRIKGWIRCW